MENKILELEEKVEKLNKEVEEKVSTLFKNLTDKEIIIYSQIGLGRFGREGYTIRGEISFVNEEGKKDFGSDIDFDYESGKGLELNVGCCGIYGKDDVYQVARVMLLANIWNNVNDIENELSNYDISCIRELCKLRSELDRQRREKEEVKRQARRKEIEIQLQVNQIYKDEKYGWQTKTPQYMHIKSITEKNVIVEGVYHYGNENQYVDCKTYRIEKESFISSIYWNAYTLA